MRRVEHPLETERRANAELRDEVKFLHQALLFTEILAAGFFGGLSGRVFVSCVAVVEKEETCRDCRGWFWCMEASRLYPCWKFERRSYEKKNRKEGRKKKKR